MMCGRSSWVGWVLGLVLLGMIAPVAVAQEGELARIRREVSLLRNLPFSDAPAPATITRGELRQRLIATVREQNLPAEWPGYTRAFQAFGFFPDNFRIGPALVNGSTAGIIGIYFPVTDEMALIGDDDGELSAIEEFTYAHELVHALQDQHLGLDGLAARQAMVNDDEALALAAIIEGDATLVGNAYLDDHPELAFGVIGATLGLLPGAFSLDAAPLVLVYTSNFPYLDGEPFVAAVRDAGGWDAVNALYTDPPRSTEQILHPESYLQQRDDPTLVTLPVLTPALGPDWAPVHDGTLGELQTAILLAAEHADGFSPLPPPATEAATGWEGDRYALWTNGERDVLLWRTVWESAADAAEFVAALQAYDADRFATYWRTVSANESALTGPYAAARIVQSDTDVQYVLTATADLADDAMTVLRRP
jgi:hypothetical protein